MWLSVLMAPLACAPAATVDAGDFDSGGIDSGTLRDGGAVDAGTFDAGLNDAGPWDASAPDAGPADSGSWTFYGSGLGADSLDNHQVSTVDVDYRFRAAESGPIASVRWYNIYTIKCHPHGGDDGGTCPAQCAPSGSVYACGNGGTMHVCLETDDGSAAHLASGTALGCVDHVAAMAPPTFPLETFPAPQPIVTGGQLYHVHWHNTDAAPDVNFTSVDALYTRTATVPRQPTVSDLDLAVFRGTTERANDTPILQLAYADGGVQGQGYMEVWIDSAVPISGASKAREQLTVSGPDRLARSLSVRLNRASGTSALNVTLETAAGAGIETGMVPASLIPLGDAATTSATWVTYTFATPRLLASGQGYHVVLSAPQDTVYEAYPLERGDNYAFVPPTWFADGYAEVSDGGAWLGFTQPGGSPNRVNADLQFFFSP